MAARRKLGERGALEFPKIQWPVLTKAGRTLNIIIRERKAVVKAVSIGLTFVNRYLDKANNYLKRLLKRKKYVITKEELNLLDKTLDETDKYLDKLDSLIERGKKSFGF